jgi:hypothetical protein
MTHPEAVLKAPATFLSGAAAHQAGYVTATPSRVTSSQGMYQTMAADGAGLLLHVLHHPKTTTAVPVWLSPAPSCQHVANGLEQVARGELQQQQQQHESKEEVSSAAQSNITAQPTSGAPNSKAIIGQVTRLNPNPEVQPNRAPAPSQVVKPAPRGNYTCAHEPCDSLSA